MRNSINTSRQIINLTQLFFYGSLENFVCVDKIAHDVENLKMKIFVPKVDESIKSLYVSMDESKKRTAMLRAKREFLEKAFSSDFFHKSDEDLKMIGVSSIDSLFSKVKIDEKGIGEESTFGRRRSNISEG